MIMDRVESILLENGYKAYCNSGTIYFQTKTVHGIVVSPHDGTDGRYMVRFGTVSAFDRWANSCAVEEFFDTEDEVADYLSNNMIDVYKKLIEYLSEEYDEIESSLRHSEGDW